MILTQRLRTVTLSKDWCCGHYLHKFCISLNNLFLQNLKFSTIACLTLFQLQVELFMQFPLNLLFVKIEEF